MALSWIMLHDPPPCGTIISALSIPGCFSFSHVQGDKYNTSNFVFSWPDLLEVMIGCCENQRTPCCMCSVLNQQLCSACFFRTCCILAAESVKERLPLGTAACTAVLVSMGRTRRSSLCSAELSSPSISPRPPVFSFTFIAR